MAADQKLYQELENLRQRLKWEGKNQTGRTPLVCSDEALCAIAEMRPKRVEDLKGVPGVGNTFIENYGSLFIQVVQKYGVLPAEKTVNLGTAAIDALKELEKKLVNINRRNRLLYMPKLSARYGYDLYGQESAVVSMLTRREGRVLLCDLMAEASDDSVTKRYKNLVALHREINKELREKGQNDLYVAYPFVIGRMPGEFFDVRCPLVLFPVKIERTPTTIAILYDDSRDSLYNSVLILAFFKFNNINKPMPQTVVEDMGVGNFEENVLRFYMENGIQIKKGQGRTEKFQEYKKEEFPHFPAGELQVQENIVLGKFPVRSSAIQKDFDCMLEKGEINSLLNELLLEVNDLDYESGACYGEKEENDFHGVVSEKDLTYINELDSSQEKVLSAIHANDKLVIQGPPGTGKSQTITSLIADFVNAGKKVLMVSEKKTALDVVYSRLGELSEYALLIDDVGNKELFYKQLENMIRLGNSLESVDGDAAEISAGIDGRIAKLEAIAQKLYQPDSFGIAPYLVYRENRKIDLSNPENKERTAEIHNKITDGIRNLPYGQLNEIRGKLKNPHLLEQVINYHELFRKNPWMKTIKKNLSEFDLLDFQTKADAYRKADEEYNAKNFLVRFLKKGERKQSALRLCQGVLTNPEKKMAELLMQDSEHFFGVMGLYPEFDGIRPIYEQISQVELEYVDLISFAKQYFGGELCKTERAIYNQLLQEHISQFESLNKGLLQDIEDYPDILRSLSVAIAAKKTATRKRVEQILTNGIGNITYAKRNGEIQRIVESKRKWSVNRFFAKFSFELLNGIKIWLLTPEVVSELLPLDTGAFDLVIFDEASQMYVEKGLPSVYRAKKVVIAGDHKQLRPASLGSGRIEMDEEELPEEAEVSAAVEEESLLDLARFKYQNVMLNFHYRAKYEELIAFSNYAFYHGRLYVSPNVDTPERPPIEVHKMQNAIWSNRSNMEEAKYVVALLKELLLNRKGSATIGVITFNSSQRDLIEDLLDEQCALDSAFAAAVRAETARKENGEDIGLFIKNIESVQGDERDIILFSIGYAKNENGRLVRNFGWLNQKGGENRLNVAISRAKKKIHIVTSFDPEELQVEDTKNDGPKILKKYLQYATAVSTGDKEAQRQILYSFGDDSNPGAKVTFDSDFENKVYNALKEQLGTEGFTIDTQVGVGGYRIDLALKYGGRYVLGIECDGRVYHSSMPARERDYHRQKYLESRGWRIYRIWSTNWWKRPQGEIHRICEMARMLAE